MAAGFCSMKLRRGSTIGRSHPRWTGSARSRARSRPAEPGAAPTSIGKNVARLDLPAKVAGPAFIHDLELPGMLHARVLRPPSEGARLESLDQSAVERLPGVVKIWRSGDFVGVCCEREYQAVKALEGLRAGTRWIESEVSADSRSWRELLPTLRSIDSETEAGERPAGAANARRLSATYSRPPIAHASMAPSCAVAVYEEGQLTVWTHSQGVFPPYWHALPRTLAPCSCTMSTGRHLLFGNNERIGSSAYWLRRPRLVENITAKDRGGNVALFLLSFVVVCLLGGFKTLETLKRVLLKVLATSGRDPHFGRRNRHTAEYNRARTERWIRRVR
jgi:hypothetical protein